MDINDRIVQEAKETFEAIWNQYNKESVFNNTFIEDVIEAQTNYAEALRNRDDIRRLS